MSCEIKKNSTFAPGEVAEWSIAAVLKTVEGHTSGGSNPSFSAQYDRKSSDSKGLRFFISILVHHKSIVHNFPIGEGKKRIPDKTPPLTHCG